MTTTTPSRLQVRRRLDYRPPAFTIDAVELLFLLDEESTLVRARLDVRRQGPAEAPLVLDGVGLELLHVSIDGVRLEPDRFRVDDEHLTVEDVPDAFAVETEVRIHPAENTALSGLYVSHGTFCTQCEAEGFRRITYFLDRPDVMARYTTTIEGDARRTPVLLSNGNRVAIEELGGGRRRVRWEDPFPKPSYLFALVAGDLHRHGGTHRTTGGRDVQLEIWVEHGEKDKCEHALRSLQRAMRWDEERFGLEYDLDLYMIVAVSDFNFGAMENKGLNVFNSKYVLARPETATDGDYESIESVIGHEYFHNWTGNRVTCRDWFQLTLKEGLTVYRDQEFSEDVTSEAVVRIGTVQNLRLRQFAEDAGPMAHPIRPEEYLEVENFYTSTVYEKGAEVVRMYETLLGREGFRRGMDLYFERHDGQAVTCDDFRRAMADATGSDLDQFERWYTQAGTPRLVARGEWDESNGVYTLRLVQAAPEGQDAGGWQPMHLPVRCALIGPGGRERPLVLRGESAADAPTERVLELRERETVFRFLGIDAPCVPSLLRGYSAPVRLCFESGDGRPRAENAFLLANDADPFNRWDAGQALFGAAVLDAAAAPHPGSSAPGSSALGSPTPDPLLVDAVRAVLKDPAIDGSMRALTLAPPAERELVQRMVPAQPTALRAAREGLIRGLAGALRGELLEVFRAHRADGPYRSDRASIDRRRTKNVALAYLTRLPEGEFQHLAIEELEAADNMTDAQAALECLARTDSPERESALATFHQRWKDDPLVIDKWFQIQARAPLPDAPARVRRLSEHPAFTLSNPNRVRALVQTFAQDNVAGFHDPSGEGYRFVTDHVLAIDGKNPQLAARLAGAFLPWRRFDEGRAALQRASLERIAASGGLSKHTREIVEKALG